MKAIERKIKAILVLASIGNAAFALAALDEGGSAPDMVISSFKALGALLLVLAVILIAAWAARRYLRFLPHSSGKNESIQILSARTLAPKSSVHLLEVEGRKMLVGSSEKGVTLLKDFESNPGPGG